MNHYVYILISKIKNNWSYVGSTGNLEQRIKDHNNGKTKSTKAFRPLEIVHREEHDSRKSAYERELFLKSGAGREEKQKIISKYSGIV